MSTTNENLNAANIEAFRAAVATIEDRCDNLWWDQPATLWHLTASDVATPGAPFELGLVAEFTDPPTDTLLPEYHWGSDHPADALVGKHCDPDVAGAVLVTETFVVDEDNDFSCDEYRVAIAVLNTGDVHVVGRRRGDVDATVLMAGDAPVDDMMLVALRAYVAPQATQGLQTPPAAFATWIISGLVADTLGCTGNPEPEDSDPAAVATTLLRAIEVIAGKFDGPIDDDVPEEFTELYLADTWEESRQLALADAEARGDTDFAQWLAWIDISDFSAILYRPAVGWVETLECALPENEHENLGRVIDTLGGRALVCGDLR